jgi:MATE family multidrug resistance protein
MRSGVWLAVGIMSACGLLFVTIPDALTMIFSAEPAVVEVARTLLFVAAGFQIFDAIAMVTQCALNGAGDTRFVMVSSVSIAWIVKLPLGWALAVVAGLGAAGAWLGLTAEIIVLAIVSGQRVRGDRWLESGAEMLDDEMIVEDAVPAC